MSTVSLCVLRADFINLAMFENDEFYLFIYFFTSELSVMLNWASFLCLKKKDRFLIDLNRALQFSSVKVVHSVNFD